MEKLRRKIGRVFSDISIISLFFILLNVSTANFGMLNFKALSSKIKKIKFLLKSRSIAVQESKTTPNKYGDFPNTYYLECMPPNEINEWIAKRLIKLLPLRPMNIPFKPMGIFDDLETHEEYYVRELKARKKSILGATTTGICIWGPAFFMTSKISGISYLIEVMANTPSFSISSAILFATAFNVLRATSKNFLIDFKVERILSEYDLKYFWVFLTRKQWIRLLKRYDRDTQKREQKK